VGGADARRLRSNAAGLRAFLPAAMRVGEVLVAREGGALAAVLAAARPGVVDWPPPPPGAALRLLFLQGPRVIRRWSEVSVRLAALRPAAPHHYLATLGVEPARQGRGLGGALLAAWLRRVDAAAASAYVETDSRRALALYRRAGFASAGDCELFGVRIWRMLRAARGDGEVGLETAGPLRGARGPA
jgi:ribosomal protein S18 acetylase RimI-like enzyme